MDVSELFGNDYNEFREVDPFNPSNEVVGYVSRKPNEYYGALIITKVNDTKVEPQLIMGSPKMHYPFDARADGTRNYRFPSAKTIEVYEKLDGTNILAYYYHKPSGQRYMTFKTRLRPFVRSGKFGDFLEMWREIATPRFDAIKLLMHDRDCNLSFEMYGARNTHLIVYDEPLAFALLFGVTNSGRILSPTDLGLARRRDYLQISSLPLVSRLALIDKDYVFNYEQYQKGFEDSLKPVDDEHYSGIEGAVWYLHLVDDRCLQIKLKPETIEAIHWAAGTHISKNSIIMTCWNAFENVDTLTIDFISELLLEEFSQEEIDANADLIMRSMEHVTREAVFRQDVLDTYRGLGVNILVDKAGVMRNLSQTYPKHQMKKVYSIVVRG